MTKTVNKIVCQFDDNYRVTESANEYRIESKTKKGWLLRAYIGTAKGVAKHLLDAIEQDARDVAGKNARCKAGSNPNYAMLVDLPEKGKSK